MYRTAEAMPGSDPQGWIGGLRRADLLVGRDGSGGSPTQLSGRDAGGSGQDLIAELAAEVLDRGALQPRDVHLGDPETLGDLGLGQLLDEP